MKKNIIYSLSLFLLLSLSACNQWLEVEPKTEIKSDKMFENETGFRDALIGCYMMMADSTLYGRESTVCFFDVLAQQYDMATNNPYNNLKQYRYESYTGTIDGIWQKKSTTGQSWICILHDKNTDEYFLHGYQLYYGEDKKNPTLRIMRDFVKPINKEMFAGGNYTIVRFQHQNYLLVANHDKVWLCNYNKENPDQGEYFANFQGENIVAMAAKDVNSTKFGGPHVGIAFENGTFRIFEVLFNESLNTRSFNLLYQKQGFGEIVDVIFKHGSVNNLNTSSLF